MTSRCPHCAGLRAPRFQCGPAVWVWSCDTQACVIREIVEIRDGRYDFAPDPTVQVGRQLAMTRSVA